MKSYTSALIIFVASLLLVPVSNIEAGLLVGRKDGEKRQSDEWLLTYYVGYQNHYLKPRDVDYSLMTHIVVGGVGVNSDGTLNEHWHLTNGDGREMALDVGKRADREDVKKLIWLGGPNEEDKFKSASSEKNRKTFVKNILKLIDEIDYDGVDIDWEPVRKEDESYILALVRDLRDARPDLIITVPVNWVPSTILFSKDLSVYKEMAKYVDKMFVMSYSMAGPWRGWSSWHGGALTGDTISTPGSIKSSVFAYRKAGVPKEQLGLGIGTYATCWEYPIIEPKQNIPATFYPSDTHLMSMRTMMDEYYVRKYERWDKIAKVPYLSFRKKEGEFDCGFVSYEDEQSIEEKVEYALRQELGGVMVWNIGTGYYPDKSSSRKHLLLRTAWRTLKN